MRIALLIFLLSASAFSNDKTEIISHDHFINSYVRYNYNWMRSEEVKLSLYSHKSGPDFMKRNFSQNIGLPIDLKFKKASTGLSVAVEHYSDPTVPMKYMLNFYLAKKVTKNLGANVNFYSDKTERDKSFTYSNLNAAIQYQISPKLGLNLKTEAGKNYYAQDVVINHIIGTTYSF